ncbi:AGC/AGC-Unique protein kinase [Coprinopsis cinerea okayama7|uniref:non-specific serine/threonine protein kinase n=1 Tax=Coprinopsis cinerea (strain Okayama-7 / 130 / ATCC MYA-4618 / FGSC 9003) TaxID=240176 RepID=A8P464_COPC7|nr:AGC/AGC-Unique protein kinase [Coprinopsis cinerea okayama7\|eukprot:XP_001838688.1 AGC/AGC-Unique protein kinase [Coprinopsis cinerea okayama7\
MTLHSNPSSFLPFHHIESDIRNNTGAPEQSSLKIYNPNYPSFVPPPKLHPPFLVHVDEIPRTPASFISPVPDLVYEGETSTSAFHSGHHHHPKRSRHGGKENAHRARPAIRRKPVPKVLMDDKIRTSSFMKISSMNSFPALRARDPNVKPQERVPSKPSTFDRTNDIGEYSLTRFLSQGAQGKVYLAKSNQSGKMAAVKVISKLTLENYHTLLQEQNLLKRLKGHPFILNLIDSFHDTENFYLISDYYPAGDLAHRLYKLKRFDTDTARFYISELIVAIRFLHANDIIHRDLKPSNILIKADGHICIIDFGLCKDFRAKNARAPSRGDLDSNPPNTHTRTHAARTHAQAQARVHARHRRAVVGPVTDGFAGTLVYMSPQVISQEIYSYETDWWSMGIILYELLQGDTPWTGSDVTCMMRKIKKEPLLFRAAVDEPASDFLYKLLEKRVEDRIHVSEFAAHEFFRSIDFDDVEGGLLTPPYIPHINDAMLSSRVLRDKEKIYVGRRYQQDVDPFPEYNYDYQTPAHSMNLEDLAEAGIPLFDPPGERGQAKDQVEISADPLGYVEPPTTPKTTTRGIAGSFNISSLRLDQTVSPALMKNYDLTSTTLLSVISSPKDVFYTPRRSPLVPNLLRHAPVSNVRSRFRHMYPTQYSSVYDPSLDSDLRLSRLEEGSSSNFSRGANFERTLDEEEDSIPRIVQPKIYVLPEEPSPSPLQKKAGRFTRRGNLLLGGQGKFQLGGSPRSPTPTKPRPFTLSEFHKHDTFQRSPLPPQPQFLPVTPSSLTPPLPSFFTASRSMGRMSGGGATANSSRNGNNSHINGANSSSNTTSHTNNTHSTATSSNLFASTAGNSLFSMSEMNNGFSEGYTTEMTLPSLNMSDALVGLGKVGSVSSLSGGPAGGGGGSGSADVGTGAGMEPKCLTAFGPLLSMPFPYLHPASSSANATTGGLVERDSATPLNPIPTAANDGDKRGTTIILADPSPPKSRRLGAAAAKVGVEVGVGLVRPHQHSTTQWIKTAVHSVYGVFKQIFRKVVFRAGAVSG